VRSVSRAIERIAVTFDEDHLVATAGLLLVATVVKRVGLERWSTLWCASPSNGRLQARSQSAHLGARHVGVGQGQPHRPRRRVAPPVPAIRSSPTVDRHGIPWRGKVGTKAERVVEDRGGPTRSALRSVRAPTRGARTRELALARALGPR